MFIYALNLIVIGLLYFFIYHSRISKKYFVKISLFYLFLISSLRSREMGADYPSYVQMFHGIIARGTSYVEKGYVLLNRFVALFTHHYVGLAIAVNLFIFIPLYYYIKNQVEKKYWALCIFVFAANPYMFLQSTFNALRQGCATGILMIAMNLLLRKKNKLSIIPFYITLLVAAQFHKSAYIMAVIPIILSIRWKQIYWIVITFVAVAMNLVGTRVVAPVVASLLSYEGYLDYKSSVLNNPIYVAFILLVIIFFLSHYNSYVAMGKREKSLVDFYLASLAFLIMALPNDMFYRVYMMMAFLVLPGIPIVCESTKIGQNRIRIRHEEFFVKRLYILYYLFFYAGYIGLLAYNNNSGYIPFRFFFQDVI